MRVWPGRPYPLGATWDGAGVEFRTFFRARDAEVELCLFDSRGRQKRVTQRIRLPEQTPTWFGTGTSRYRAGPVLRLPRSRPVRPGQGHRFNPNKVVLDPYAKAIGRDVQWDDSLFGYQVGEDDLSFDERDNAAVLPAGSVIDTRVHVGRRPPAADAVAQDADLRAARQRPHRAASRSARRIRRGTYAGLASEAVINHLKSLGVTAVELLPVHFHLDDRHLVEKGLMNYWGYNTLSFFAPHLRTPPKHRRARACRSSR